MWMITAALASAPPISGTWQLAEPAASLQTKHAEALDSALSQLPWAFRPIAKGKLARPIANCATVKLALDSSTFAAHCVGDEPFSRPVQGPQAPITGRDGKPYRVEIDVASERVQLSFLGDDGGQRTRYAVKGDELLLTKEIVSSWFEAPVAWTVRYRKAP